MSGLDPAPTLTERVAPFVVDRNPAVAGAAVRCLDAWIDGRTAWYSRDDYTPMHYGFAAYLKQQDGFIDYAEMSLKMLRGENLTNPYVRKELRGDQ